MKIGLLTWHYLDNYGSFLQTHALYSYLSKTNEVKLINYRKDSKTGKINDLLRFIKYTILEPNTRKGKFYKQRMKYFRETKMVSNLSELKKLEKFDTYICGSDQIWSNNRLDMAYFFSFLNESDYVNSYAASTVIEYDDNQKEAIKKELVKFNNIAVREAKGISLLKELTDKKITEVVDPTLLLSSKEWEVLCKKSSYDNYILCYFIGDDIKYNEEIETFAKKYNKKIVNILLNPFQDVGNIHLENVGPFEFLGLLKDADFVFTDSYHGTIFSMIFHKNFYTFERFKKDSKISQNDRTINLVTKLNLTNRYVTKKDILSDNIIDYNKTDVLLKKYIDDSKNYLENVLRGNND